MYCFFFIFNAIKTSFKASNLTIVTHFLFILFITTLAKYIKAFVTPAMQPGLMKKPMAIEDITNLVQIEAPKTRGKYKIDKQIQ